MFHLIRRTHLFAALILAQFILLYAFSGFIIEFPAWLTGTAPKVTRLVPLSAAGLPAAPEGAESVAYVKDLGDLHGKTARVQIDPKTGTCDYVFAGTNGVDTAKLLKDADHLTVTTTRLGFFAMLNRMHHLEGFTGGAIYGVWGVMFDLVCLALLAFACSGVYLWHKHTKRHALGWIVLAASLTYTVATALWCVAAP